MFERTKHSKTTACTHAILSGWPSPTDSEVKRKVPGFWLETLPIVKDKDWISRGEEDRYREINEAIQVRQRGVR